MLKELYHKAVHSILDKVYEYKTVKLKPSEWAEKNVFMTRAESPYPGYLNFDHSPYTREVLDCISPESDVEMAAIMKCSQSGFTATVIVPAICYTISEEPCPTLFASGTDDLVRDTVTSKLDPVLQNSGLRHLLRSNSQKQKNNKSGDTDFNKEFAGGSLKGVTYKPSNLRMFSVKLILADELDNAKRIDKEEGDVLTLLENRARAFGNRKKKIYLSSPTTKGRSNIEVAYNKGDKRKWNWECPHCKNYIPIEWRVEKENGAWGGIKYQLNDANKLIEESVHYECQICEGKIFYNQKGALNLTGKWIPTAEPERPNYRSYQLNALVIPPGFDSWVDLVYLWLEACPPNEPINQDNLKSFLNTSLGQLWEDLGREIKANALQENAQDYDIGTVPDKLCEQENNGKIIFMSLVCDLGGIMQPDDEDVRLDWEVTAHTNTGVQYRIEHGSIGTFKNNRNKSSKDKNNEFERMKWTYAMGQPNSVWNELDKLIDRGFSGDGNVLYPIDITLIDTAHFTTLAYNYIKSKNDPFIVGIRGYADGEYRNLSKDTPIIKRSQELKGSLYILQVNQIKDKLATNMQLKRGIDGYQPAGFMNFPQSNNGRYDYPNYFKHYEAEKRIEEERNGVIVGFAWKKKHSTVQNHFFDIAVYTLASTEIYIDIFRKDDPKRYAGLTWEDYCMKFSE